MGQGGARYSSAMHRAHLVAIRAYRRTCGAWTQRRRLTTSSGPSGSCFAFHRSGLQGGRTISLLGEDGLVRSARLGKASRVHARLVPLPPSMVHVYIEDVESFHERAKQAGAEVTDLELSPAGDRRFHAHGSRRPRVVALSASTRPPNSCLTGSSIRWRVRRVLRVHTPSALSGHRHEEERHDREEGRKKAVVRRAAGTALVLVLALAVAGPVAAGKKAAADGDKTPPTTRRTYAPRAWARRASPSPGTRQRTTRELHLLRQQGRPELHRAQGQTTYTIDWLSAGRTYTFYVTAVDSSLNTSGKSNTLRSRRWQDTAAPPRLRPSPARARPLPGRPTWNRVKDDTAEFVGLPYPRRRRPGYRTCELVRRDGCRSPAFAPATTYTFRVQIHDPSGLVHEQLDHADDRGVERRHLALGT